MLGFVERFAPDLSSILQDWINPGIEMSMQSQRTVRSSGQSGSKRVLQHIAVEVVDDKGVREDAWQRALDLLVKKMEAAAVLS